MQMAVVLSKYDRFAKGLITIGLFCDLVGGPAWLVPHAFYHTQSQKTGLINGIIDGRLSFIITDF